MRPLRCLAIALLALTTAGSAAGCGDIKPELRADFRWDRDNGLTEGTACPIDTTYFHDESSGDPTSWEWRFPDGSTSTEQNPAIDTPPQPDHPPWTQPVTLTVHRGNKQDSITKDYVIGSC